MQLDLKKQTYLNISGCLPGKTVLVKLIGVSNSNKLISSDRLLSLPKRGNSTFLFTLILPALKILT